MRRLAIFPLMMGLCVIAAGCSKEPQQQPGINVGNEAAGPDIPTQIDAVSPQGAEEPSDRTVERPSREEPVASDAAKVTENPFQEEESATMPTAPAPSEELPAPTLSAEEKPAPSEGPELRAPMPTSEPKKPAEEPAEDQPERASQPAPQTSRT